jgi:hypothetical protein
MASFDFDENIPSNQYQTTNSTMCAKQHQLNQQRSLDSNTPISIRNPKRKRKA